LEQAALATLVVIHGLERGKRYTLDQPVMRVGRDPSNPIRVPDNEISRQHAEVRFEDDGYTLVDLKSSNGTFVNGRRVPRARLDAGDRIQIGQTVLVFGTGTTVAGGDLAKKITLITRGKQEDASAIVKAMSHAEGSQYLARPDQADAPWLKNAIAHLRVLYETSQAISHIVDLGELLERILELTLQSVQADRGCIFLLDTATNQFHCGAAHFREGADTQEQIEVSRTIMDFVVSKGEGVRTSDAAADERFGPARSIVRMGIREAICVPMQGRHSMLGVVYLDVRTPPDQPIETPRSHRFTDDQLKLLIAIGHQAALAIEDTRHHQAMVERERLAAVGQTIATLSHHIKNILQGIRGGSHLVEMGLSAADLEQLRRGWKIVNKNQGKIFDLVMDMLTYSKEREPVLENADVNDVVREVVELMEQHAAEVGVALRMSVDESIPRTLIDPEGIHRAVLNIVSNAIDATQEKEGGVVEVSVLHDAARSTIAVSVGDNGVGIAADEIAGLFTLFSSTKGARGTGIGLAVSDKIVREHGGQIVVASEPGKGSTFTIELPVRSEHPTIA
jgi:signal transduction histidine kinase/pSer/pThr/pTyr-binding forkhead associated (FHA) protein